MEVTLDGLRGWYKGFVKKWGMVVIGLERGHPSRAERYIQSGSRLLRAIATKIPLVESPDHARDLQIMGRNVQALLRHAERNLVEARRAPQDE